MTPNQLGQIAETALKERAPMVYREMKENGTLAQYVRKLSGQTLERIGATKMEAMAKVSVPDSQGYVADSWTRVQTLNSEYAVIEETAIAQMVEEIEGLQTTELALAINRP